MSESLPVVIVAVTTLPTFIAAFGIETAEIVGTVLSTVKVVSETSNAPLTKSKILILDVSFNTPVFQE